MRKYYIDNLRAIIILLLIPYHAAMAWNVWGEPNYIFFEGNKIISSIVVFLSPYSMPLLFLIAGMCMRFALQKRTVREYIWERFKKLLIPFLAGTLLIMPPMTYIADKFNYGYEGNFFQHYRVFFTKLTDLTGADGGFSVGHFWFVLYLFAISVAAVIITSLQRKIVPKRKRGTTFCLICLLGLPLPFFSGLLSVGGKSFAEYMYLFLVGYYFFSSDGVIHETEKYKWLFFSVGLTSTVFNGYLSLWSDAQYPLLGAVSHFLSEWFMTAALIGMGKRYLDFSGRVSKWILQRSFSFYIFHFIWVVLFQYSMPDRFRYNRILLYVTPVFLAYAATFLCCEIWNLRDEIRQKIRKFTDNNQDEMSKF